jgi:hypothetical protein
MYRSGQYFKWSVYNTYCMNKIYELKLRFSSMVMLHQPWMYLVGLCSISSNLNHMICFALSICVKKFAHIKCYKIQDAIPKIYIWFLVCSHKYTRLIRKFVYFIFGLYSDLGYIFLGTICIFSTSPYWQWLHFPPCTWDNFPVVMFEGYIIPFFILKDRSFELYRVRQSIGWWGQSFPSISIIT